MKYIKVFVAASVAIFICIAIFRPRSTKQTASRHDKSASIQSTTKFVGDHNKPVASAAKTGADLNQILKDVPAKLRKIASGWNSEIDEPAAAEFADWVKRFEAASPEEKRAMEEEGVTLASARRTFLKQLIKDNPERALELALPISVVRELPVSIRDLVEERVSGRGELAVLGALAEPGKEKEVTPIFRTASIDGKDFQAFAYGRRLGEPTLENVPLNGIAVDHLFAVNESPVRILEPEEAADVALPKEAICSVSGESASVYQQQTPVDVGGNVEFVCHIAHVEELSEKLVAAESGGTAASGGAAASSASEGQKKLLFIRVDFSDVPGTPFPDSTGTNMITGLNSFYTESSYGRAGFVLAGQGSDITPTFRMPHTAAYYGTNDFYTQLRTDARNAAAAGGYVLANYNYDLTCMGAVPGFNWSGLGYVGAPGAWIRITFTAGVPAHELGHNFGLNHANFWDTGGKSIIGSPGTNVEYGDPFDTMGMHASAGNYHFNARNKRLLNWLTTNDVKVVTTSGTYRIFCQDNAASTGIRGLSIAKNSSTNYWVEYRQKFANRWMTNGARILWAQTGNQQSLLLDTTPGSPNDRDDAALVIGRTFADKAAGIYITTIGKGGTVPESLDVVVNKGTFPNNVPPTISIQAGATNIFSGANVLFTASATDANGDALAYYWDFGDGTFGSNSASVSKTFTTGEYVVRCTVTDMKGGTASDSVIIRAGSPSTYRISGKILDNNVPVEGVRVYVSGTKMTYTDSDGSYALVGLTPGSYTVNAQLDGYTFYHPGFSNPIGVGPNVTNADFNTVNGTPLDLVSQASSRAVAAGSSVTFAVSVSGSNPTYHWRFNGAPILNGTNSSYTVTNAQLANAGEYSVIVSNAFNSLTSSNAVLSVNVPPSLAKITNKMLNSGETLVFTNSATDLNTPATNFTYSIVSISIPDANIDPVSGVFSWTAPQTDVSVTNSVTLQVNDNGNPPLTSQRSFQIFVVPPPNNPTVAASAGGSLNLQWNVFAGKTYQVQYKNSLNDADWSNLGDPIVADGSTISISDLIVEPNRFYRLVQVN
jgi:hypothetical protein